MSLEWTPTDIRTCYSTATSGKPAVQEDRGKDWSDNVADDCQAPHLSLPEANRLAESRTQWRSPIWNREIGATGER